MAQDLSSGAERVGAGAGEVAGSVVDAAAASARLGVDAVATVGQSAIAGVRAVVAIGEAGAAGVTGVASGVANVALDEAEEFLAKAQAALRRALGG